MNESPEAISIWQCQNISLWWQNTQIQHYLDIRYRIIHTKTWQYLCKGDCLPWFNLVLSACCLPSCEITLLRASVINVLSLLWSSFLWTLAIAATVAAQMPFQWTKYAVSGGLHLDWVAKPATVIALRRAATAPINTSQLLLPQETPPHLEKCLVWQTDFSSFVNRNSQQRLWRVLFLFPCIFEQVCCLAQDIVWYWIFKAAGENRLSSINYYTCICLKHNWESISMLEAV